MKIVRIVLLSFMLCYFANANEDNSGFLFGGQIAYAGMKYDASAEVLRPFAWLSAFFQ